MRSDARANRDRIVQAGKTVMQLEGGDVPVERICRLAKVTRATFYRNFDDRAALYEAVLDRELETMVVELAKPDLQPLAFLHMLVDMMIVYDKFLIALPDMADYNDDGVSEAKIVASFAPALKQAKLLGLIGEDISGDDVMLMCRMATSDWRLDRAASKETSLKRRLELLLRGLSPR